MVRDMQWWNDFLDWFNSDDGWQITSTVVLPFLAIVIAGIIGALVGRGSTKRLISLYDRQQKAAAVAALISAGRRASVWSTLSAPEKEHVDSLLSEAETRVRLLPVAGASIAADWAAHQLADMKRNSANYSFQTEQTLVEYRDGLVNWQDRPARAKKLFSQDLATWKYEDDTVDRDLVHKQQQWASQQVSTGPVETTPAATSSSAGS